MIRITSILRLIGFLRRLLPVLGLSLIFVHSYSSRVNSQEEGPVAVSSNGVSISFQNEGPAESGVSSGVSIGFGAPINPRGQLGNNPNSGTHADPVNTATGNFVFDKVDLSVAGKGIGFEFRRFYNSLDGTGGPLGTSWTHSYNLSVSENTTANTLTVRHDDGREVVYANNGGTYTPIEPGTYDNVAKNPDSTFTVTRKDQRKLKFRTNGKLDSIADRNNNTTTMEYDASERLSRVNIPGGRSVDFTYDSSNRITQIADTLTPTPRT